MNILVVEVNPGDANLLQEAFAELNSQATLSFASDGDECLRILFAQSTVPEIFPDLIFLDLKLPTVSGYEVLRRIKTDVRTRHIPVIVLSSARSEEEVEKAYEGHANAYVQKPASVAELMKAARGLKNFWLDTARLSSSYAGS